MPERDSQQELEIRITPVKEFYFDPKRKVFVIGNEENQTEQTLRDLRNIYQLKGDSDMDDEKMKYSPIEENHSLTITSPIFTLIEFPSLREWIANLSPADKKDVSQQVMKTMKKTYKTVEPSHIIPKGSSGTFMSFNAYLYEDGRFNLSVFGNCACLGATPDPISISHDRSKSITDLDLPVELTLHNIDYPVQALSLYAGAGTIAWLEKQSRSVDVEE